MRSTVRTFVAFGLVLAVLLCGCTAARPKKEQPPQTVPAQTALEKEQKEPLTPSPSKPAELKWPEAPKAADAELNSAAIKGYQLVHENKTKEAEALLQPLAGAKNREVQLALGVAAYNEKNLDNAAEAYVRAIEVDPKSAVAQNNLGNVYRDQKKIDLALAAYQKAMAIDPTYLPTVYNLASMLQAQGRLEWSADVLRSAIAKNPQSADLHVRLGNILALQLKTADARREFEVALKADPSSPGARVGLEALPK